MARLNPRFEFKYGGSDGKEIGLRLTFFGHTIVLDPMFNSVKESKEAACKKALWKLRKFNPHWLCPPFPNEGPTGPEWDWTKLVEGQYRPYIYLSEYFWQTLISSSSSFLQYWRAFSAFLQPYLLGWKEVALRSNREWRLLPHWLSL